MFKIITAAFTFPSSANNIRELKPIASCALLEELYLRKNNVDDLRELEHLSNLPNLRTLWLDENPCANSVENYRLKVIRYLPRLKMLDNRRMFHALDVHL